MTRPPIASGYKEWIKAPARASSRAVDFGAWWQMEGVAWRVSWLVDTGELYAAEQNHSDRFLVLGRFDSSREVNRRMREWSAGNDLRAFIHSLKV